MRVWQGKPLFYRLHESPGNQRRPFFRGMDTIRRQQLRRGTAAFRREQPVQRHQPAAELPRQAAQNIDLGIQILPPFRLTWLYLQHEGFHEHHRDVQRVPDLGEQGAHIGLVFRRRGGGTLIVPAPGVVDADEDAQQVGLEGETILVPAGDQIAGAVAADPPVNHCQAGIRFFQRLRRKTGIPRPEIVRILPASSRIGNAVPWNRMVMLSRSRLMSHIPPPMVFQPGHQISDHLVPVEFVMQLVPRAPSYSLRVKSHPGLSQPARHLLRALAELADRIHVPRHDEDGQPLWAPACSNGAR